MVSHIARRITSDPYVACSARTRLARSQRHARISKYETNGFVRLASPSVCGYILTHIDSLVAISRACANGAPNPPDGISSATKATTFSIISSNTTPTNGFPPKRLCYTNGFKRTPSLQPSMFLCYQNPTLVVLYFFRTVVSLKSNL